VQACFYYNKIFKTDLRSPAEPCLEKSGRVLKSKKPTFPAKILLGFKLKITTDFLELSQTYPKEPLSTGWVQLTLYLQGFINTSSPLAGKPGLGQNN
jgi:hypothetical protein